MKAVMCYFCFYNSANNDYAGVKLTTGVSAQRKRKITIHVDNEKSSTTADA